MKEFTIDQSIVRLALSTNDLAIYKAVNFGGLSVLGGAKADSVIRGRMASKLEDIQELDTHFMVQNPEFETGEVSIEHAVPDGLIEGVALRFRWHYLWWQANEAHRVAWVPMLELSVIVVGEDDLEEQVRDGIVRALARTGMTNRIHSLLMHDLPTQISIRRGVVAFKRRSDQEIHDALTRSKELSESVLHEFVDPLWPLDRFLSFFRDDDIVNLAQTFCSGIGSSMLLIGPSGVGKTALVHELARRAKSLGLEGRPIWETTGARIVAGMAGFGEWQERCGKLVTQAQKANAILYLGNLFELCHTGRSKSQQQSPADFLAIAMKRGQISTILECTPEQFTLLEKDYPGVVRVFETQRLEQPTDETLLDIMCVTQARWTRHWRREKQRAEVALSLGDRHPAAEDEKYKNARKVKMIARAAHEEIASLHRRYAGYSASPGREVRFLEKVCELQMAREAVDSSESGIDLVREVFERQSGLPRFLLDDSVPFPRGEAKIWFGERVLGQDRAVEAVVDVITTLRAAMQRGGKPIANLLFVGPTGVGKTQLARSLAQYIFNDERRLLRFDMSEYQRPEAVRRLVGGAGAGSGLLTAALREQPFSVVLFDEFEKAHPDFFDLLLQICGEARLTDPAGRVASFASAVVIMTSNLGAERAAKGRLGFGATETEAGEREDQYVEAVRSQLRPEIFNRMDRIIPFSSLPPEIVEGIARRELEALRYRPGVMEARVRLEFDPDVIKSLAAEGFDERYGARPLKRRIASSLLPGLSDELGRIISGGEKQGRHIVVGLGKDGIECKSVVKDEDKESSENGKETDDTTSEAMRVRRRVRRLARSEAVEDLRNELKLIEFRSKRGFAQERNVRTKQRWAAHWMKKMETLVGDAEELEERVLFSTFRQISPRGDEAQALGDCRSRCHQLLAELDAADCKNPNVATVAVFGRPTHEMLRILKIVHQVVLLEARASGIGQPFAMRELLANPPRKSDGSLDLDEIDLSKASQHSPQVQRHKDRAATPLSLGATVVTESLTEKKLSENPRLTGFCLEAQGSFVFKRLQPLNGFFGWRHESNKSVYCEIAVLEGTATDGRFLEAGRLSLSHYAVGNGRRKDEIRIHYASEKRQLRFFPRMWQTEDHPDRKVFCGGNDSIASETQNTLDRIHKERLERLLI